ncbi:proline-tRNA ligase [Striga asiatica]|uniref:Proline-tRNA ligase n=1 Tax=Striga asiatica TaxID=4170 RepID=A0A5A7QEQ5_STRAF|nr:proline-tRNA ligase [Striga asiatica]
MLKRDSKGNVCSIKASNGCHSSRTGPKELPLQFGLLNKGQRGTPTGPWRPDTREGAEQRRTTAVAQGKRSRCELADRDRREEPRGVAAARTGKSPEPPATSTGEEHRVVEDGLWFFTPSCPNSSAYCSHYTLICLFFWCQDALLTAHFYENMRCSLIHVFVTGGVYRWPVIAAFWNRTKFDVIKIKMMTEMRRFSKVIALCRKVDHYLEMSRCSQGRKDEAESVDAMVSNSRCRKNIGLTTDMHDKAMDSLI